jgi:hypothetical protein
MVAEGQFSSNNIPYVAVKKENRGELDSNISVICNYLFCKFYFV